MGSGSWDTKAYCSYSTSRGVSVDAVTGVVSSSATHQDMFKERSINPLLDPKNVIRECCDSEEHPNTKPVILALDVTGSMGDAATEVARMLNVIMTKLYEEVEDVQFMIMGIGDLAYDRCPIQASQFESDIRIAEQLDKVYFEFGGGGNAFESYTAAWYFASRHTKLDCWKRGEKGIIITMGDEQLNPYLPQTALERVTGDSLQGDVETADLYEEVKDKYDVYHLNVDHRKWWDDDRIPGTFESVIGKEHFKTVTLNNITDAIVEIVAGKTEKQAEVKETDNSEISW